MSALPVYQVEFIPLERRLGDRRVAPRGSVLPPQIAADRRNASGQHSEALGRRGEDRLLETLKVI